MEKLPVKLGDILQKQYMVPTKTKAIMPEDFDEIQLTEEQVDHLVFEERCRIYFDLKSVQKKNMGQNERIEAAKQFSAEELKSFIVSRFPGFILDDNSAPVFNMLCLYFSRDKSFEQYGEGFSLYKGLALHGLPGCGKTEMLNIFQVNKRQSFHLVNINTINQYCKDDGIDSFKKFTAQVPGWGYLKKYFFQEQVTWAIDDIGLEEPVNDYGNKAFVFSKIIQERYANKKLMQYYPLHITSMLTPDQIGEKYGVFIRSRFREMFNYIEYKGKDRRK